MQLFPRHYLELPGFLTVEDTIYYPQSKYLMTQDRVEEVVAVLSVEAVEKLPG